MGQLMMPWNPISLLNWLCPPSEGSAWLCLGDFNLIYEARDKNNSNINHRLIGHFRQALDASELMELRLQNRRHTWSNGKACPTLVYLDKAFYNKERDALFPKINLQALSNSLSDHSSLSIGSHQKMPKAISFRFEPFWMRVPSFLDTVTEAWSFPARGSSPLMIFSITISPTLLALCASGARHSSMRLGLSSSWQMK